MNVTQNSTCVYGIDIPTMVAKGYTRKFVDGGPQRHTQYIHRVTLINLVFGYQLTISCSWFQINQCYPVYVLGVSLRSSSIEAANTCTKFIIFCLTQPRLEPMIYNTQGDHVNNYNTDTVCTCDKGR
jgi:hypothetical protein